MKTSPIKWILPLSMLIMLVGCEKCIVDPPTITTTAISSITPTSVVSGGEIASDGGATITVKGVCWSTNANPTIALATKTDDGTGTSNYSSTVAGLSPGVTYFLKAYATNKAGTGYGNELSFTTPANPSTITTTAITAITSTSATSGGTISSDGGGGITAKGVCWSTTVNPTITNSKTNDGSGNSQFSSNMTGLAPGTKYYVKAYATNSAGTSYGNETSFTTLPIIPTITTTLASAITSTSATSGGNVTSDGGGNVTSRGVCWNTTTGPTISNNKTTDGVGTGSYTSVLTPLTANTTYYVKAYATNSAGTAYGNEVSFKTSAIPPTVSTIAASSVTSTTASSGGNVTSDGGAPITVRGVCWGTSSGPTTAGSKATDAGTTGTFISTIAGLTSGTNYFIRAFATNSAGTNYGNEITFTTLSTNDIIFNPNLTYGSLADIDGNVYRTIQIGTQVWMAENLKTTKYNDGASIPLKTDNLEWIYLATPGYCWFNNELTTYKNTYGALYNWYTVNTAKLCPVGWHVPTDSEWIILTTYLGGVIIAGDKLKEAGTSHWNWYLSAGTNSSGYTALPGGHRGDNGQFYSIFTYGWWWSSSEYSISNAWSRTMYCNAGDVLKSDMSKRSAFSIRCLKD